MTILAWIVLGLIVGWLASILMGSGGYGILGDIVVGIVGAIVGGFIGSALFGVGVTGFNLSSIIVALIGAIIVIAIYRAVTPGRRVE
jgi:uncharacterized membrane protein YeaQ/YmgE (transglycosylase-associated protein family)